MVVEVDGGIVETAGAETAAKDEQHRKRSWTACRSSVGGLSSVGGPGDVGNRSTHGIAREHRSGKGRTGKRYRRTCAEPHGDPVGKTRRGVLLMNDDGDAPQSRHNHTRKGGITADTDDDTRTVSPHQSPGLNESACCFIRGYKIHERESSLEPPAGKEIYGEACLRYGVGLQPSPRSDEPDGIARMTPSDKRFGQSHSGVNVTSGPPAGDQREDLITHDLMITHRSPAARR